MVGNISFSDDNLGFLLMLPCIFHKGNHRIPRDTYRYTPLLAVTLGMCEFEI
jgi:hypothetical protein